MPSRRSQPEGLTDTLLLPGMGAKSRVRHGTAELSQRACASVLPFRSVEAAWSLVGRSQFSGPGVVKLQSLMRSFEGRLEVVLSEASEASVV